MCVSWASVTQKEPIYCSNKTNNDEPPATLLWRTHVSCSQLNTELYVGTCTKLKCSFKEVYVQNRWKTITHFWLCKLFLVLWALLWTGVLEIYVQNRWKTSTLSAKLIVTDLSKMLPKICLGSLNMRQLIWIRRSIRALTFANCYSSRLKGEQNFQESINAWLVKRQFHRI
jgi:hypothetical protein